MSGEIPTSEGIPVKSPREQLLEEIQKEKQAHPVGWGRFAFNNLDMNLPVPEEYPWTISNRLIHEMLSQRDPERRNKTHKEMGEIDHTGMSQRKLNETRPQFFASIDQAIREHAPGIFQKAAELQQEDNYVRSVLTPLMSDLKTDTPEAISDSAIEFIKRVQMTKVNVTETRVASRNYDLLCELMTDTILDLIDPAKNPEKGAYRKRDFSA